MTEAGTSADATVVHATDMGGDGTSNVAAELGLLLRRDGNALVGHGTVVPEMHVPGTNLLRMSVLATWTDLVAGLLTVHAIAPKVPTTLDLDVQLFSPPFPWSEVELECRTLKVGRSVVVQEVRISADGAPVGVGAASFMAAPGVARTMPSLDAHLEPARGTGRLSLPLAERARCRRAAPGVASLPMAGDVVNSSGTLNGGLIALAVEEAVLSASGGTTLLALAMRYLRPLRVGPAVATATLHGSIGQITVRDAGSDERVAVVATARTAQEDAPEHSTGA